MKFSMVRLKDSSKLQNQLDLIWILVKTNFKMRYQNSILGILWVLIKPYSTFLVLYFIWSNFGGLGRADNFSVYLLVGIVFFTYFQELIIFGQMSLLDKAHIILKVNFSRQIAVISNLLSAVINLFINMVFVIVILILNGLYPTLSGFIQFLILTSALFLLCSGISLVTSILTVRFRDLKNVFELGLFLLFWASPIFYTIESAPLDSSFRQILNLNPIAHLLNQIRASLGVNYNIDFTYSLVFVAISIIVFILGWFFFKKRVRKIAEYF